MKMEVQQKSSITIKHSTKIKGKNSGRDDNVDITYKIYGDTKEELLEAERFINKEGFIVSNKDSKDIGKPKTFADVV